MDFFVANYDYGTGSAYVGILADSAAQIEAELKFVTVVDPLVAKGLTEDLASSAQGRSAQRPELG